MKNSFQRLLRGESLSFAVWFFLIAGVIAIIFPFLFTRPTWWSQLNFSETGPIGDTIGGITAPFIASIGIFMTFLAFWIQAKANKQQALQFEQQSITNQKERFETKFYDLLKLHRDNVNELNIQDKVHGRKAFIQMVDELRFCYCVLYGLNKEEIEDKSKKDKLILNQNQIFNIAFLNFFFGVENDLHQNLLQNIDPTFLALYHLKLNRHRNYSESEMRIAHENGGVCIAKLDYFPFTGHASQLGHYYRHLFQTAKFVLEQEDKIVPNKYEYIKTLRAQLSTHEQLLLYYNSLSVLGQPWNEQKLLTEYRFIKNIPLPYADFFKSPKEVLGEKNSKGESIFEWDEIMERVTKI